MDADTRPPEGLARCSTRHTSSPMIRWPPALSTQSIDATTTTEVKGPAILTRSRSSTLADRPSRSATTVAETRASCPSVTPTGWLPPTAKRRPGTGTPPSLHGWRKAVPVAISRVGRESAKLLRLTAACRLDRGNLTSKWPAMQIAHVRDVSGGSAHLDERPNHCCCYALALAWRYCCGLTPCTRLKAALRENGVR